MAKMSPLRHLELGLFTVLLSFPAAICAAQTINNQIKPNVRPIINPTLLSPLAFTFDTSRAVCIVLIHGVTNSIPTSTRLISELKAPDRPVNTLRFARHYWGYDFVQGLVNIQASGVTQPQLYSLSDCTAGGALNATPDAWEVNHTSVSTPRDHFITACGCPGATATGPTGCKGFLTIMMTYRDGSESLKKQTAAAAAQIRSLYNSAFSAWDEAKRPQLILLCHSGGGLVARTICSKPASLGGGISSLGEEAIPVEQFTSSDLGNMEFIRNRTLYIITLSTPHEGAPIAKVSNQIGAHLAGAGQAAGNVLLGGANLLADVADQDPQIDFLKELCPNIMQGYNLGPLDPHACKRGDASLIPIYCLGARAAGGPFFFSDPNQHDNDLSTHDGGIDPKWNGDMLKYEQTVKGASNRREYEAWGLLKADYLTTLLYGITSATMIGPELLLKGITGKSTGFDLGFVVATADNPGLDIVKIRNNGLVGCLDPPVYNLVDFAVGAKLFYLRRAWANLPGTFSACSGTYRDNGPSTEGDGMIDCDGFVPIISSLGVRLGTNTNNVFDHAQGGSWYRFYRSAADYDNHGSIMQRMEVGSFIEGNITGVNYLTSLIKPPAAGPYVNTGTGRSSWRK